MLINSFFGNSLSRSVFEKYNLLENETEHSKLTSHIPRHNINTFLALSGLAEHLQAMLMGRVDIKQNQYYQHLALKQRKVTASAWLLSFVPNLNKWFDHYVCLGSMGAVAITFTLINVLEQGQNNVLFHASMMYAVVIIYGFVGMRFYTAIIAGWAGGLIGVAASTWLNGSIDWTYLHRTYTFSSFLGMALAYATDRQHRENYLQNCMIELNRLELMRQAQQLSILSQQDALTGLANRRYLDEVLENEWKRATRHEMPLTIMMIDIDFFKLYNDTLGHIQGDQCLRRIAIMLGSIASRSGDLAARYGGEEFLLLFSMTDRDQAIIQVQRLMELIRNIGIVHPRSNISKHVTISVGVATITPTLNDSLSEFVSQADHALYIAKSNGRNQYHIATSNNKVSELL